jgi:hypothetical protein
MPILGRRFLHPFRVHHVNPDDFLRRKFIDTNGDVGMLMAVPLAASLWISLDSTAGCVLATSVTAFCGVGLFTNQVHQWAHMPAPPAVVRALQDWGIILGRQAHQRHHDHPYDTNYCIATGWCNRPLAAIDFFRRLERLMSCVTGVQPRADDRRFESIFTRCGAGATSVPAPHPSLSPAAGERVRVRGRFYWSCYRNSRPFNSLHRGLTRRFLDLWFR